MADAFPLDPFIAYLCDQAAAMWALEAAAMASVAACATLVASRSVGYHATPEAARGTRHKAYSEGVAKPRRRETAADRAARERAAWGF